jgi:hypothetical protein
LPKPHFFVVHPGFDVTLTVCALLA